MNLLHPSFPTGFLTESLLRGLGVCTGSCRENTIRKVREKQSRKQRSDAVCDFKDGVTKEIERRGAVKGRQGFLGAPSPIKLLTRNTKLKSLLQKKKKKRKAKGSSS